MQIPTKPQARGWAIDDLVTHLRIFGTDDVRDLRTAPQWILGAAPECSLQLVDPTERVSRRHAQLSLEGQVWHVRDLGSTNGTRYDGDGCRVFDLGPGVELGIGGITLIAESPRLIELRRYLARLLGWAPEHRAVADRALRAVREMATGRATLVIAGDGDLVPFAKALHGHAVGTAPFVVATATDWRLEHAAGGTLCVVDGDHPHDIVRLSAISSQPELDMRVVFCTDNPAKRNDTVAGLGRTPPVVLPRLAERRSDMDRLFLEFAADAVAEFGVSTNGFREHELLWLRKVEIATLDDLRDTMRRVVALRNFGVVGGARKLGIDHAALSRWAKRRGIPT